MEKMINPEVQTIVSNQISFPKDPSLNSKLQIRFLEKSDRLKGFTELLGQLTKAPPLSQEKFDQIFENKSASSVILVCEHLPESRIVGTASLFIEQKFILGGSLVGHLEEVVVDSGFRKLGISRAIIKKLVEIAKEKGCYKMIGSCNLELLPFYRKVFGGMTPTTGFRKNLQ